MKLLEMEIPLLRRELPFTFDLHSVQAEIDIQSPRRSYEIDDNTVLIPHRRGESFAVTLVIACLAQCQCQSQAVDKSTLRDLYRVERS